MHLVVLKSGSRTPKAYRGSSEIPIVWPHMYQSYSIIYCCGYQIAILVILWACVLRSFPKVSPNCCQAVGDFLLTEEFPLPTLIPASCYSAVEAPWLPWHCRREKIILRFLCYFGWGPGQTLTLQLLGFCRSVTDASLVTRRGGFRR